MNLIDFTIIAFFLFVTLRLMITYTDKKISTLRASIQSNKIDKGLLSIKDLNFENYDRFIQTVNMYLLYHGFNNIVMLDNSSTTMTDFIGILNSERVYISSTQNLLPIEKLHDETEWQTTDKDYIQGFLSRMVQNNCKKGIIINNSRFSDESISFTDHINLNNSKHEIKLVDGYELTKYIRIHRNYFLEEEGGNVDV